MTTAKAAKRDLDRTRADIIEVATAHFARLGFFGARVDDIAAETASTKRMIYYCFGSKDELFAACLGRAYESIRALEEGLHLENLPPRDAIRAYVDATVRYHEAHPELAQLVRTENLLGGVHLAANDTEGMRRSVVALLDEVLARGRARGEFGPGPTGIELHVAVTSLANFRVTNEASFNALFGYPTRDAARLDHDIAQYQAMMLGWLSSPPDPNAA